MISSSMVHKLMSGPTLTVGAGLTVTKTASVASQPFFVTFNIYDVAIVGDTDTVLVVAMILPLSSVRHS